MSQVNKFMLSELTPCQVLGYVICTCWRIKDTDILKCVDAWFLPTFAHIYHKYECVVCAVRSAVPAHCELWRAV